MECLIDESYECKSSRISSTLDCEESGCCYYIKICEYYKKIQDNESEKLRSKKKRPKA